MSVCDKCHEDYDCTCDERAEIERLKQQLAETQRKNADLRDVLQEFAELVYVAEDYIPYRDEIDKRDCWHDAKDAAMKRLEEVR